MFDPRFARLERKVMGRAFLGQNFLHDPNWQSKIASYFTPEGAFGEIGPGHGELTEHLLKRFKNFYVFEKDPKLVEIHQKKKDYQNIPGDFLDWDFKIENRPIENFSFVGNLPYEAGTGIVVRLCENATQVKHFLFLLQKEVVERICAIPKTRDFGSLTVLVQGQFQVESLDVIPPEAFTPPPKVFSQLVRGFQRKDPHPTTAHYRKFVQSSFLNKRKVLRNQLKSLFPIAQVDLVFEKLGFTSLIRAEEIPVDVWPKLYEEFQR